MDSDSRTPTEDKGREEGHGGILQRIEEKLDRLLGPRNDDWHEREWAPPGDPRPRFYEGPPAAGWDSSFAGPPFHRIDVGSVGSDADHPASLDPEQGPFFGARSSAREYYLAMRARRERERAAGNGAAGYDDYRRRKKAELDREYADYCRDRQECFDRDFDAWRQKRAGPAAPADRPAQEEQASKHEAEVN